MRFWRVSHNLSSLHFLKARFLRKTLRFGESWGVSLKKKKKKKKKCSENGVFGCSLCIPRSKNLMTLCLFSLRPLDLTSFFFSFFFFLASRVVSKVLSVLPSELQVCFNKEDAVDTEARKKEEKRGYVKKAMRWFKTKFFSWVNSPDCCFCSSNQNMKSHSMITNPSLVILFFKNSLFSHTNQFFCLLKFSSDDIRRERRRGKEG